MKRLCQSCGMPLDKDPKNGGSNADGSKNLQYCSYCYVDGKFTAPAFTADQMQDFCAGKLHEHGMPKIFAWMLTRNIPRLERWRKH
jgi:hypothetical protein